MKRNHTSIILEVKPISKNELKEVNNLFRLFYRFLTAIKKNAVTTDSRESAPLQILGIEVFTDNLNKDFHTFYLN